MEVRKRLAANNSATGLATVPDQGCPALMASALQVVLEQGTAEMADSRKRRLCLQQLRIASFSAEADDKGYKRPKGCSFSNSLIDTHSCLKFPHCWEVRAYKVLHFHMAL